MWLSELKRIWKKTKQTFKTMTSRERKGVDWVCEAVGRTREELEKGRSVTRIYCLKKVFKKQIVEQTNKHWSCPERRIGL